MVNRMYEKLATAILLQAVQDFRGFPKKLAWQKKLLSKIDINKKEETQELENEKTNLVSGIERKICLLEKGMVDLEVFFNSEWCELITQYDGKLLLKKLKALKSTTGSPKPKKVIRK